MKKCIVAGFLAIGLLLLGCTTQVQQNPDINLTTTNASGGEGNASGSETGEAGGIDLKGLGYEQLVTLGVPIECEVISNESGLETQMTLKIKGDKIRGNGTVNTGSENIDSAFLISGNDVYVWLAPQDRQSVLANCSWLRMTADESQSKMGIDPTEDLKTSGAGYECKLGSFGDEKFAAPAEGVCDFGSLLRKFMQMTSPCDIISDSTKKETCMALCDSLGDYGQKMECAAQYLE